MSQDVLGRLKIHQKVIRYNAFKHKNQQYLLVQNNCYFNRAQSLIIKVSNPYFNTFKYSSSTTLNCTIHFLITKNKYNFNGDLCISHLPIYCLQESLIVLQYKSYMLKSIIALSLLTLILTAKAELKTSDIQIVVKTNGEETINKKTTLLASKDLSLKATQSSKIYVYLNLGFEKNLRPEFVAGRLVHSTYNNITKSILGSFNKGTEKVEIIFDIGNPLVIQPISGQYSLQILVGDNHIKPIKRSIAQIKVTFLKSSQKPNPSDLLYEPKQQIIFKLQGQRVDPPTFFTFFSVLLIVISFVGFLYSLYHLKANLNLFPVGGMGGILNIGFVGLIGVITFVLVKFWVNWTFLETVKVLGFLVLPTVIIGNYAILSLKK